MEKKQISVYIDKDVYEEIEQKAKKEERSLNKIINMLLRKGLSK
jgi:hypothetical protein